MTTKNVKFTELLDCPSVLIANDLIVVKPDASGLTEVTAGSIIIPTVGSIPLNNIAVGGANPPLLKDSEIGAGVIVGGVPPFPLNVSGHYIDMNKGNYPFSDVIGDVIVNNFPAPNNHLWVWFGNAQNQGGIDQDVTMGIVNNSVLAQDILMFNQSPGNIVISAQNGGDAIMTTTTGSVILAEQSTNNSMTLDTNGFNVNISTSGNIFTMGSVTGNSLNAGSGLPNVLTSDILILNINGSSGLVNQVLTADGLGNASWQNSAGGSSNIPSQRITNNGQVVAFGAQDPIQGTVTGSFWGLSGFAIDTFTDSGAGGLYEFNLSLSVQVGGSLNNSLWVKINGGASSMLLGYLTIGSSSFSNIYNLNPGDSVQFLFENDDLALSANLFNVWLSVKRIGNTSP